MARNGSGTYSVVNTFQSGDTITASSHNGNWSDVAAEMTNSVAADGQTSMTGPLKAANGTVALPALSFASDTDTGIYHKSANTMAGVVGGVEVLEVSSTGLKISGVKADAFPSGTLMLFQQTAAPTGWTKQATHNDKALRVVSGTASSGGSTAFSSVMAARTIDLTNIPSYTLPMSLAIVDPGHSHPISLPVGNNTLNGSGASAVPLASSTAYNTAIASTGISISGSVFSGGGAQPVDFAVQYVDLIIAAKT